MDGPRFETWFTKKLLPNIKPGSVIVMDNASYHSVKIENIPNKSTRKAEIQSWLTSKNIQWRPDMIIRELLELVGTVRSEYDRYRIDEIAKQAGHTILRLPPYHCELNPIEMIWGHIKGRISAENTAFNLKEVAKLAEDAIKRETPEMWKKSIQHVIKVERKFWELDDLIDTVLEPFVIQINEDTDSTEDSEDSSS